MTENVGSISTAYPVDATRRADEQRRATERIAREAAERQKEQEEAARKAVEAAESDQTISTVV